MQNLHSLIHFRYSHPHGPESVSPQSNPSVTPSLLPLTAISTASASSRNATLSSSTYPTSIPFSGNDDLPYLVRFVGNDISLGTAPRASYCDTPKARCSASSLSCPRSESIFQHILQSRMTSQSIPHRGRRRCFLHTRTRRIATSGGDGTDSEPVYPVRIVREGSERQ